MNVNKFKNRLIFYIINNNFYLIYIMLINYYQYLLFSNVIKLLLFHNYLTLLKQIY